MLKVISLMKRRDDMSREEFYNWAKEHAARGANIPTLKQYRMNAARLDEPEAAFDCVFELWFDDAAAFDEGFATDAGKAAREDAMAHCSQRIHLRVEENILK